MQMDGGAVFGFLSARIRIEEHVLLSNNIAFASGGAVGVRDWESVWNNLVAYPTTIVITGNVQCRGNHARSGGCLWVSDTAVAEVSGEAVLDSNSASAGGGATVDFDASLVVAGHVQWLANSAREGGAIAVSDQRVVVNVSGNVMFHGNRAEVASLLTSCARSDADMGCAASDSWGRGCCPVWGAAARD
eukprot:3011152-Rhodomonas_salina.1